MERLRGLFVELGFRDVRSFIQTGNIFFMSDDSDRPALEFTIHEFLSNHLGYDVPVFLRTISSLHSLLIESPFEAMQLSLETRHLVVFISMPLPSDLELPATSPTGEFEILAATPGEAFVLLRTVNGKSGNAVAWVERTFQLAASARFYHTLLKILDAAKP
jgi:uncharacterized protein (DUF1697 family)